MTKRFDAWVFDLDNTLYPAECDLFAQIDVAMTRYVSHLLGVEREEALKVQKQYYLEHGTTLAGLMARHSADPHHFLEAVHDIDYSPIQPDPELGALLSALPGRRFVLTNGSRGHAERVVARLGVDGLFQDLFAIEDMNFAPKPNPQAFRLLIERHAFDPADAIFFDDLPRNVAAAKALGFTSVLVQSDKDWSHEPEGARPAGLGGPVEGADHVCHGLKAFLRGLG